MVTGLQRAQARLAEAARLPPERLPEMVAGLLKTLPSQLAEAEHASPSQTAPKDGPARAVTFFVFLFLCERLVVQALSRC